MLNSALQTVLPTMIILRVREGEANKWGLKPQHLWPGSLHRVHDNNMSRLQGSQNHPFA